MHIYNGSTAAIVTGADEKYASFMLGLCDSLNSWQRYLHVIDIGLGPDTRDELARRAIPVHSVPDHFFANVRLPADYFRILYMRPSLPDFIPADIIMWIDADCWVQRTEAIASYLDMAAGYPDDFALTTMLDVDYPRCVDSYGPYLKVYYQQYEKLFGQQVADAMWGKAILSAGIFAARRTSPMWRAWQSEVSKAYASDAISREFELGFMADMLSFNVVLHANRNFRTLSSELNWCCHCSNVARDGDLVRIQPSGRVPSIIHLADMKNDAVAARYREQRLFYEPPNS